MIFKILKEKHIIIQFKNSGGKNEDLKNFQRVKETTKKWKPKWLPTSHSQH